MAVSTEANAWSVLALRLTSADILHIDELLRRPFALLDVLQNLVKR